MTDYLIYSIEDDENIAQIINITLKKQGYTVETFLDGESFMEAFKVKKPNMILLDMMLPGIQGRELLTWIRNDRSNDDIIILIVSAKNMANDRIDGLDRGADDYIGKPFDLVELISRVNAHVRRSLNKNIITYESFGLDKENRVLKKNNALISLTPSEYVIVSILFSHKGEDVSKRDIAFELYGPSESEAKYKKEGRTIDMLINNIRQKIGDSNRQVIKTVFKVGYRLG